MARLRTRVERAAVLHRQAAAAISATATAVDGYSPSSAPAEQYAEQHDLAARLRAAAADLVPGWLGTGLDAVSAATPAGDTAVPAYLRIGLAHPLDDARFPAIAPLLGSGHLAIDADARDPRVAGLLRSVLLRLVAAAAHGSLLIRVIDAAGDGDTTAAFAELPSLAPPATDHPGMQGVLIEADHWIRSGGGGQPASHYVLVIASLPELTDGNDLARIAQLARAGVKNRLHLIVAGWPPPPLTAETTQAPLPHSTQVSLRNPYVWVGDPPGATYAGNGVGPSRLNAPVYLDPDPPADVIRRVCAELAAAEQGGGGSTSDPSLWAPSPQRWRDYVAAAQRLDAVRREAAKVVTDQTAAAKRARTELATTRRQVAQQHKRIGDLVSDGRPVPLHPTPIELGAAEAALGRLAQAASARAAAARVAAAASTTGSLPTGIAVNPGLTTGGFPTVTPSATSQLPTGAQRMSGPPGAPPPPPAPHGRSRYPTAGQAGIPGVSPGPTGASGFGAPRPAAYGPGVHGTAVPGPGAQGPAAPSLGPPGPTGPALGAPGPTGPGPHHPGSHGPGPHGPTGPAHSAPSAWAPAPVQVTSPPRPASPMPYAPVSGPGNQAQGAAATTPVSDPAGPPTSGHPTSGGIGSPPVSGPAGRPPVYQVSGPAGRPPTQPISVPAGPPGTGMPAGPTPGQPVSGPFGPPVAGPAGPPGMPPGPPVSGVPHPAYVNTGSFPVVSAPPNSRPQAPVSGPPAAAPPAGPPSTYPRLPEAAMAMIGEARAALHRADAELSDVDARINRSPGIRNATIYGAYAVLFAIVQLPMMASLTVRTASPVAGVPCGLVLVVVSFWLAWLTIGFAYREPSGHRPRRTPALGIAISLLAAAPAFAATVLGVFEVLGG